MKISEILFNVSKLRKDEQIKYLDGLIVKFKNDAEMLEILESIKNDPPVSHEDVYGDLYSEPWNMKDACEYLDKSESTVRRWIKSGIIKAEKISNEYQFDYIELKQVKNLGIGVEATEENIVYSSDKEKVISAKPKRLSIEDAAEYLGKSVITLRRWIKSGKLQAFQVKREYEFDIKYLKQIKNSIAASKICGLNKYCSNAFINLEVALSNNKSCRYTMQNKIGQNYVLKEIKPINYIAVNEDLNEISRCA